MHNRKKIGIHILVWSVWNLMLCSWAIVTWQKQPVLPLVYNLGSLMVVFYATRWMATKYWRQIEGRTALSVDEHGLKMVKPNFRFYVMQWPLAGVFCIVFAYIGISWVVDGLFIEAGMLPKQHHDFYLYTYMKWATESMMVCGGNVMAAIEYDKRKQYEREKLLEDAYKRQYEIVKEYEGKLNKYLKNYYRPD